MMVKKKQYETPLTEAFEACLAGTMIAASARDVTLTEPDDDELQVENGIWEE